MATLKAIEDANMIFISAQPDITYFHWQVELYMYQFAKHGISDRCYAIFGYTGTNPSEYAVELSKRYNIYFYKDTRDISVPHYYIPSIRPHLLKQFFQEFPELGKCVFYHDADIFLSSLPKFELLVNDQYAYLSDTSSYINYTYIHTCGNRYKAIHTSIADDDIFTKMCQCMNISEDLVRKNNSNSGGAQYLLKDITSEYWANVETNINKLYPMLKNYEIMYPITHHIQSWTSDMWVVLWEYWKLGKETRISSELRFSWASDDVIQYAKNPIFHLAGITENDSNAFYKGKYKESNIFKEYTLNRSIFNHVSPNSATYEYVKVIKEYVDSGEYIYTQSFVLLTKETFGGLYKEDISTVYFNKAVWRSMSKTHLIFYNSNAWILIETPKEYQISKHLEGLAVNSGVYPYSNEWNIDCKILKG
jgi:hypothetical protein